ncbi:ATP-dependent DNA ligase [Patescibacteria group bacterium]|nr:ATP-dependent DNA ligase [Patescibacteria group bacterium]
MRFSEFSKYLLRLEETTKRLEMTDILSDLISKLDVEEIDKAMYLASGYVGAPFEEIKFNIAEKMMIKIIEQSFSTAKNPDIKDAIQEIYTRTGDLGTVVFEMKKTSKDYKEPLISDVYSKLLEIANVEGTGSQDQKITKTSDLIKEVDPLSAKNITRIILGIMRLGFTELTIIASMANYLKDKTLTKKIEAKYNIHPDIGLISKKIKEKGIKGIDYINMEIGVPVLSQKAQRVSGMEEIMERINKVWAEFKFDGTRVQLHFAKKGHYQPKRSPDSKSQSDLFDNKKDDFLIKTYTRNLEETTHQYPDIVEGAKKQIKADSVILDGEGIGYNKETGEFLPFQETIQRKRKYNIAETAKNIPLKYFVFDILYLNGESVIEKPLHERRKLLSEIITPGDVIEIDEYIETEEFEELEEYFELAKSQGLEGLVIKTPNDPYQAGARSYSWIKYKTADQKLLSDTVDCVVLGYYHGKGVRSKFGIGGFLVGVYDEESNKFKTISKIGTGLTEEDWGHLKNICDKVKVKELPKNIEMNKIFKPDILVEPKIVVEIGADEITVSPTHSAGYALRFPRLIKFRQDKKPEDSTTVKEIQKMYKNQKNGK